MNENNGMSPFAKGFIGGAILGYFFPNAWKGFVLWTVVFVLQSPLLLWTINHYKSIQQAGWARCDAMYPDPAHGDMSTPQYMPWYTCTMQYGGVPLWIQFMFAFGNCLVVLFVIQFLAFLVSRQAMEEAP